LQSAKADRPCFQYSLATLLQLMTLASLLLTFFSVSVLAGVLASFVQMLALWRTIVAVQLNNKARRETRAEEKVLHFSYSFSLIGLTYGCVYGLSFLSNRVASACISILDRSLGHDLAGWVTPVIADVSVFIVPFVLLVYAYGFLSWSWPRAASAVPCADAVNT
jgi:hypothetical protein